MLVFAGERQLAITVAVKNEKIQMFRFRFYILVRRNYLYVNVIAGEQRIVRRLSSATTRHELRFKTEEVE